MLVLSLSFSFEKTGRCHRFWTDSADVSLETFTFSRRASFYWQRPWPKVKKITNKRGNFLQPPLLIISISRWCSHWLLSKHLWLCQDPAKYAISVWDISCQCTTWNRCISCRIRTLWLTKRRVSTYFKYLIIVVRMYDFIRFVLNAPKYIMLQHRICEFLDDSISQRLPHANHH